METKNTGQPSAKDVIKAYLDKRAADDPQFAEVYAKPKKNIDECFRYILGEAHKRGNEVCMSDDEVFGLAVHYYDEDNIVISKSGPARVSRPQPKVELTEEEKEEARQRAIERYEYECLLDAAEKAKVKKKKEAEKKAEEQRKLQEQFGNSSLFDFSDDEA